MRLRLLLLAPLSLLAQPGPGYAGPEACSKCHNSIAREWAGSLHRRIFQPATKAAVEGDFAVGKVVLRGSTYLPQQRNGSYFLTESDLTGKPVEHHVDFTLGGRRIQQYLTTLSDGRIVLLPAAWDNIRKQWIHDLDVENPEEPGEPGRAWNRDCYSCHVSGGKKNFDLANLRYHTTWQASGVDCERCHGPGANHASTGKGAIVNPAHLDATRATMICAQCHSFRDTYAAGFPAGGGYYDYFLPVMEFRLPASDDPAYWPDGRPRWFANEAVALWQSRCFLKGGATCESCHSKGHTPDAERNPRLQPGNDALCAGCHKTIAANAAAHTHHAPKSAGSSCMECHMPATVAGVRATMRDHSMSIPEPENTARHAVPNACNQCHRDRDAAWATQQVNAWYGPKRRRDLALRADAFSQARENSPAAIPALLQILDDRDQGAWIRANAAGYLSAFPNDPAAYSALRRAFSDADPLVRAIAATAIRPRAAEREALAPELVSLLKDPARTVRISAGIALVAMGVQPFPGEDGARFEEAKQLYRERAALTPDDPQQQFAAGRFLYLAGDMESAAAAFRATLELDPALPAKYPLARSLAAKGDIAGARQTLESISRDDPQYSQAQQLLAEVKLKDPAGGGAQSKFLEGQVQYQQQYYAAALSDFEDALQLAPKADWTRKAQIYRAVCLEKLGRAAEAETAMRSASETSEGRQSADLQLAFAELLSETGRAAQARQRIDELITSVPNDPLAYFWRARILLQLHLPADAARAAEESIRLQPQLPQAHNLLIRIYQMLGRTREAAQQAEWLRDYQRRSVR